MNLPVLSEQIPEILGADDVVHLTIADHPLRVSSQTISAPSGLSVTELVAYAEERLDVQLPRVAVYLNGEIIDERLWHRIRVKAGVSVVVRAVAAFEGGDMLKSILGIAVVALALVLPVVIFPAGGIAAALLGAAITIGGQLLINALFPIAPPQLREDSSSRIRSYSLTGGQNQARPFDTVPEILGEHRWWPDLGARFYTEIVGNEQYLRGLFVWGYGPKQIRDIKIGETLLSSDGNTVDGSFEDVEIETREGWPDDDPVTLYPNEVIEESLSIDLTNAASWQERTTAENINEISLDYYAPGGIARYDSTGTPQLYTVSLRAEYRPVGSPNWLLLGTADVSGRSRDAIRGTIRRVVPAAGQFDVRISKTSLDYSGDDTVQEDVIWTALRGFRNSPPIEFPHPLAVTALRIRASSQLNGTIQQLNGIVRSIQKSWNDSDAWVDGQLSRNPADHFRYVLQSPSNSRPRSDTQIDLETIQEWHEYCTENDFVYDAVLDDRKSVYDRLVAIAAAGRAAVLFRDGKWSVVWDNPNAPIVQHFTPRNSWGFRGTRSYRRLPHAWRVRFINREKGYVQDERIVYDDGYSAENATLFEAIEFQGQTDPALNWRHGRFHIAQARLRPETYSLNVDIEHLVVTRGDRVVVNHDVPLFGLQSGRVKSVQDNFVTLDEPVVMDALKNYAIRFRLSDGSSLLRSVATDDGENFVVELTGTGEMPEPGDLFLFGEAGQESVVLRIKTITPGQDGTAKVTMVDDAPAISAADQGIIPAFESNVSTPVDVYSAAPINLHVLEVLDDSTGSVLAGVVFSWEVLAGQFPSHFEVQWRDDSVGIWRDAPSVTSPVKETTILGLQPGAHSFRVRAIFSDGSFSNWATLSGQVLAGVNAVPGNVTNFRIQVIDDQSTLSWDPATGPVSYYTIRHSPVLSGALWGSAIVLQAQVDATSVQVPTLVGTFLIKAVTLAGVESENAAFIISDVSGLRELNVVEVWQGHPDWTGDSENVTVDDETLVLTSTTGVLNWPEILEITSLYWSTVFPYEFGWLESDQIVDLGEVFTSRVSAQIEATGENVLNVIGAWGPIGTVPLIGGSNADLWLVRLFESHTNGDPEGSPVWSDWAELALRDITARAFRFRLQLYSLAPGITPVVFTAQVTIDMPDRTVAGNDLVSDADEPVRVDFDPPLRELQGLAIIVQDAGTGDYYETANKDETGFDIQFFNSSATGVARTFDYVAKGYGRRVT